MIASVFAPINGVTIVGITGRARAGKDDFARALLRVRPGAERLAFSDAVAVVARVVGCMTTRDAAVLQQVGTQLRDGDVDVWLRSAYYWMLDRRPSMAVITGVRYDNEEALVRRLGGVIVGVTRPDAPALVDRDPSHPVEQGIDAIVERADYRVTMPEISDDADRAVQFDMRALQFLQTCLPN